MNRNKISLNELKSLIKKIINENSEDYNDWGNDYGYDEYQPEEGDIIFPYIVLNMDGSLLKDLDLYEYYNNHDDYLIFYDKLKYNEYNKIVNLNNKYSKYGFGFIINRKKDYDGFWDIKTNEPTSDDDYDNYKKDINDFNDAGYENASSNKVKLNFILNIINKIKNNNKNKEKEELLKKLKEIKNKIKEHKLNYVKDYLLKKSTDFTNVYKSFINYNKPTNFKIIYNNIPSEIIKNTTLKEVLINIKDDNLKNLRNIIPV
jgi:hypothetical protein